MIRGRQNGQVIHGSFHHSYLLSASTGREGIVRHQRLSRAIIFKLLTIHEFRFDIGAAKISPADRIAHLRQIAAEFTAWADQLDEFYTAVAAAESEYREHRRKAAQAEAQAEGQWRQVERARRERLRGTND
jgi:hypothetical protein